MQKLHLIASFPTTPIITKCYAYPIEAGKLFLSVLFSKPFRIPGIWNDVAEERSSEICQEKVNIACHHL